MYITSTGYIYSMDKKNTFWQIYSWGRREQSSESAEADLVYLLLLNQAANHHIWQLD